MRFQLKDSIAKWLLTSYFVVCVGNAHAITGFYQYFDESADGLLTSNGQVLNIFRENGIHYLTGGFDGGARFPIIVDNENYQIQIGLILIMMRRVNEGFVGDLFAGADRAPFQFRRIECATCDNPATVARAFYSHYATKDVQAIAPFVDNISGLNDQMQSSTHHPPGQVVGLPTITQEINVGDYAIVNVPFRDNDRLSELPTYVVRIAANRYVVDWKATVGHNSPSLAEHIQRPPMGSYPLRVYATVSSLYVHDFRDAQETHYAMTIRDSRGTEAFAYVKKESDAGKRIIEILRDGAVHTITVFANNYFSRNRNVFEVTHLRNGDWRID